MNKLLFLVFFFSFLQLAATTVSNNYDLTNPLPTYLASSNSYPNINNNLKINHKKPILLFKLKMKLMAVILV